MPGANNRFAGKSWNEAAWEWIAGKYDNTALVHIGPGCSLILTNEVGWAPPYTEADSSYVELNDRYTCYWENWLLLGPGSAVLDLPGVQWTLTSPARNADHARKDWLDPPTVCWWRFALYCRLPFGRLHHGNPEIVTFAGMIGRSPSALAMKLSNIASLDPAITSTGRSGLRKASANDRAMWDEMHSDWKRFAVESHQAELEVGATMGSDDKAAYDEDIDRTGEDRVAQTTVRVGQSFFRSAALSAYNERCCITGLSLPTLLVASHIVPWRHDGSNRVNPRKRVVAVRAPR